MTFTLVSGLPSSDTSLMMQILRADGIDPMHDVIRTPSSIRNLDSGQWCTQLFSLDWPPSEVIIPR